MLTALAALPWSYHSPIAASAASSPSCTFASPIAIGWANGAATTPSGSIVAWGQETYGAVGNGYHWGEHAFQPLTVPPLSGITMLSSGQSHFATLKSDGTVWTWGDNSGGDLGLGIQTLPGPGAQQVPALSNVVGVSAGGSHTLAVKADGTVWAWGTDYFGELGNGLEDSGDMVLSFDAPQQVSGINNAVTVAAGYWHSLVLANDGTVWAFGGDPYGQLGNGTDSGGVGTFQHTLDFPSPVKVSGLTGVTGIAAGIGFSLALKSDGTVWQWGSLTTNGTINNTPVQVPGLSNIVKVAGGQYHGLALRSDGTLFAWGGAVGGLGTGFDFNSTPAQVLAPAGSQNVYLSGVTDITANLYDSMALTSDGHLYGWGSNGEGQLGDGTTNSSETPVLVGCPKPTRSALIYIPGIAGSELVAGRDGNQLITNSQGQPQPESYKQGDTVWINNLKALIDSEYFDLLRFGADGNSLYGDFYPDGKMVSQYGGVETFFNSHQYTEGKDFFVFTYDWRYPAETNVDALDSLVSTALASSGADTVDIVAHSMGTMVLRSWLLGGTNRNKVNHVVMLGGDQLGTPKGSYTALAGTCLPDWLCFLPEWVVKYIVDTLPGGLDQAVTSNYWAYYDGSDKAHAVPFIDRTVSPPRTDYQDLRDHELAEGASATAVSAGEAFHSTDLTWAANVSGKLSLFAGSGHCTLGQITASNHQWPPFYGPTTVQYNYGELNGDGTVTLGSASLGMGSLGGGHLSIYYRDKDHNGMGTDTHILTDVLSILQDKSVSPGTVSGTWPFCNTVSARSPIEIQVTDASGNKLGGLAPGQDNLQVAGGNFDRFKDMKIATVANPGSYRVDLAGTGTGDSTIEIRTYQNPDGLTDDTIFSHVPTTPNTKAFFTFDVTTGAVSPMTVDVNGDGKNVQTLQPAFLNEAAANDTTPPNLTIDSPAANQAVVGTFPVRWMATDPESGIGTSLADVDVTGARQVLNAPGTIQLPGGQHSLDVYSEDHAGNNATAHRDFTADAFAWMSPLSSSGFIGNAGRTIPVKFTVTTADGTFVSDSSVVVDLVDGTGATVAGPMSAAQTPDAGVLIASPTYQANLRTDGVAPGAYTIRVRFNSPALLGQLSLPIQLN